MCIDIYKNRIEITSPGGMVTGKVVEKTIDKIIASERRNPVIADLFARMKFMERRGSGLKKITEKTNLLFGDNRNHVEFYSDNDYFKVTIFNANYQENIALFDDALINDSTNNSTNDSTNDQTNDYGYMIKLSDTEKAIIELLKENKFITIKKMSCILLKDISTIKKSIHRLKIEGIIIREGNNKNGKWLIKEAIKKH